MTRCIVGAVAALWLASCSEPPTKTIEPSGGGIVSEAPDPEPVEPDLAYARCAGAEPGDDVRLERAAAALFGATAPSDDPETCVSPVYFAEFADGAALVTMTGVPGEACHGCSAPLSFHVLSASGDGYVVTRSYDDVVSTGTFGSPGEFKTLRVRNMNSIAIEHGGTFQGYSYGVIDFVLFGEEGAAAVEQEPKICLFSDSSGVWTEDTPTAETIEGEWRVHASGDGLIITLKKAADSASPMISTWRFDDSRLVLDGGDYPETGSGGECF